jgi:hypothetical protein
MIRRFRILGVVITAALALSALAGPAAEAQNARLTVGAGAVQVSGGQLTQNLLKINGTREFKCNTATTVGPVPSGTQTTLTLSPTYANCSANVLGERPATITFPASCDYVFHATEPSGGTYTADVDLACSSGDVVIHVYSNHTNHTAGVPICTYTIPAQVGLGTMTLTNKAGAVDDVEADINLTGITGTWTGPHLTCYGAGAPANTHFNNMTLEGTATLQAKDVNGNSVNLTVSKD